MLGKIAAIALSGILVISGIFSVGNLGGGYEADKLLNDLKDIYNEEFIVCSADSSGGCIDHSHNFYTICGKEDKDSRFTFETITEGKKKDKLQLSDSIIACYGVAKACNVINEKMEKELDVVGIIPETLSMFFNKEVNEEDLRKGKYLSEPESFINSFGNIEYIANYFYPLEYDKDAALREVVNKIEELEVNKCKITIAFVTDEEYKIFQEKHDNLEYVYVRDDQYGISSRNCVFILEKSKDTISLRNAGTYEKIDISNWIG